ncbi:RHS repeat domain-containing protein, partial [Stagnihabitans tardus]
MMLKVHAPMGGELSVDYAPTSDGVGNDPVVMGSDVSGVRLVVKALTVDDGRGHVVPTYYRYADEVWDDVLRQSRGFTSVREYLPKLANEPNRSIRTTVFDTSSSARAGAVLSETLWYNPNFNPLSSSYNPATATLKVSPDVDNPNTTDVVVSRAFNTWSASGGEAGKEYGPFILKKTGERLAARYREQDLDRGPNELERFRLIETLKTYAYDYEGSANPYGGASYSYGQPTRTVDYGFSDPVTGVDIDASDNVTTDLTYVLPTATVPASASVKGIFVAGLPASRKVSDSAGVVMEENYFYDGTTTLGAAATPLGKQEGNLTRVRGRSSLPSGSFRLVSVKTYDSWGNVLTDTNAGGYQTQYAYDTKKNLFQTAVTDARGNVSNTNWDTGCQAVSATRDPNNIADTFTYDGFCREIEHKRSLTFSAGANFASQLPADFTDNPFSTTVTTYYNKFGDPKAGDGVIQPDGSEHIVGQWIGRNETSAIAGGEGLKVEKTYLDGFGRTYMVARSAATYSDQVVTIQEYDARGNVDWTSIPTTSADADLYMNGKSLTRPNGTTSLYPILTKTLYDQLDRPIEVRLPDYVASPTKPYRYEVTAYETEQVTYSTASGSVTAWLPSVRHDDSQCFDLDTSLNCGRTATIFDGHGRMIKSAVYKGTLTGDKNPQDAVLTHFTYDALGRLTGVTDPISATWSYVYDGFGNRLTSNDPDLGTWTMTYDANNNLLTQTDAKGQVITFTYDELDRVLTKTVAANGQYTRTEFIYDERATATNANKLRLTTQRVSLPTTSALGQFTWLDTIATDYAPNGVPVTQTRLVASYSESTGTTFTTLINEYSYAPDGTSLSEVKLPITPGDTSNSVRPRTSIGTMTYDTAGRLVSYANGATDLIHSVSYDIWGQPDITQYGSSGGAKDDVDVNPWRGSINQIRSYEAGQQNAFVRSLYTRADSGRIKAVQLETAYLATGNVNNPAAFTYTYDYAGRLLNAVTRTDVVTNAAPIDLTQAFTYDDAGRMLSNTGAGGVYDYSPAAYGSTIRPPHAPGKVGTTVLTYDANGNMTNGLDEKVITYDGENRPVSVQRGTLLTCYVYGADGGRLKKISAGTAAACPAQTATGTGVTLYSGMQEIRNWKTAAEQIFVTPVPNIRLAYTTANSTAYDWTAIHHDALGSVRGVTNSAGVKVERSIYRPYGNADETLTWRSGTSQPESHGYIGERLDADAGLQYLNARYYDPKLAMFIQPDWWEVT